MVHKFVYLESLITKDGGSSEEIKRILAMTKAATTKLVNVWRGAKNMNVMLTNYLILIAAYFTETWTLKIHMKKSLMPYSTYGRQNNVFVLQ